MTVNPSWFERNPRKTLLVLAALSLLLALVVVELLLEPNASKSQPTRYIRLKEHRPGMDQTRRADRKTLEQQFRLVVDSLDEKPYPLRTDENGFIKPSRVHPDPELTLAFLGGSTTECAWVDEESRFAYRSGVLLGRALERRINALNGGTSGANTLHLIDVLLNKVAPLKPDVVVLMENINDVNIMLFSGSYWNDSRSRSLIVVDEPPGRLQRLSSGMAALLPGIADRLGRMSLFKESNDEFEGMRNVKRARSDVDEADYRANLVTFVEICRARGFLPVLMTQFNRLAEEPDEVTRENMRRFEQDWGMDYATYKGLIDGFNETVRRVARERGVLLVDLEARVPKQSRYMYDIVHLNTAGSELVAEIIAEELAKDEGVRKRAASSAGTRLASREG